MRRDPPSPIWTRRIPQGRPSVTEETIVEAALGLIDEEGVDALTMRSVAERMGVTAPTIYWHVESKEGLLERLYDRLCSEVSWRGSGDWRIRLRSIARNIRAVFRAHRDAARLAVGRFPLGPHGLRITEVVLAALAEAGLDQSNSANGAFLFFSYVTTFSYQETIMPTIRAADGRDQALKRIEQYLLSLPEAEFPHLVRSATALSRPGLDQRFDFGLEQILLGLAAGCERRRAGRRPKRGNSRRQ